MMTNTLYPEKQELLLRNNTSDLGKLVILISQGGGRKRKKSRIDRLLLMCFGEISISVNLGCGQSCFQLHMVVLRLSLGASIQSRSLWNRHVNRFRQACMSVLYLILYAIYSNIHKKTGSSWTSSDAWHVKLQEPFGGSQRCWRCLMQVLSFLPQAFKFLMCLC